MKGAGRGQYTGEFRQEAVLRVRGGESVSSVSMSPGTSGQTLRNRVTAKAARRSQSFATKS